MTGSFTAKIVYWVAYAIFRSPFARRSKSLHNWTMKLFRYASERGNKQALTVYGNLLYYRGGDELSRQQGALYIQSAAKLGDVKSLWQLGQFFEKGVPPVIAQSDSKAFTHISKAAEAGHPLAIKRLVEVYTDGQLGEEADSEKAGYWEAQRR